MPDYHQPTQAYILRLNARWHPWCITNTNIKKCRRQTGEQLWQSQREVYIALAEMILQENIKHTLKCR